MSSINLDSSTLSQVAADPAVVAARKAEDTQSSSNGVLRQQLADEIQKAAETAASQPSVAEVQQAAADISDYLSVAARSLSVRVDRELDRPVVTVLDSDTEKVVRQIPSEEALAVARFIRDQQLASDQRSELAGVILSEQG